MKTKIDDGGPAFPFEDYHLEPHISGPSSGMSLRDWFAGQVLAGQWTLRESEAAAITQPTASNMAESAYRIADAMLKARHSNGG